MSLSGSIDQVYGLVDGIVVTVPEDKGARLNGLEGVAYVEEDSYVRLLPIEAESSGNGATDCEPVPIVFPKPAPAGTGGLEHVARIGADWVWEQNINGAGALVGIVDTGIDATHPDLIGRLALWKDFVYDRKEPFDYLGHGTHVAGVVAGTGKASDGMHMGVAPGARIAMVQVFHRDTGFATTSIVIAAMDWLVGNNVRVLSMSLGSDLHVQALDDAVHNAVAKGVVVIAAGNSACWGISCPGDSPGRHTVGAVDSSDRITWFSSRGPTFDGRIEPDLVAPGYQAISTSMFRKGHSRGEVCYIRFSGTSMATPIVAGTVALMLAGNPPADAGAGEEHTDADGKAAGRRRPQQRLRLRPGTG
jgi:serine protease AprX